MAKSTNNQEHTKQGGNSGFVIERMLPLGKENAISTKALMGLLGLNERELREQVAAERNRGAIICSNTDRKGGYFKPTNKEELQNFYNSMQSKATGIFKALRSARKELRQFEGQQDIQDIQDIKEVTGGIVHD